MMHKLNMQTASCTEVREFITRITSIAIYDYTHKVKPQTGHKLCDAVCVAYHNFHKSMALSLYNGVQKTLQHSMENNNGRSEVEHPTNAKRAA